MSSGDWRPKLSVKIPRGDDSEPGAGFTPLSSGGNPPSSVGPPPVEHGLISSGSFTAMEIELLKQVQDLISPHAAGAAGNLMDGGGGASAKSTRGRDAWNAAATAADVGLETPTVDMTQARSARQMFFAHSSVSTLDRIPFQLTDELLVFVWNGLHQVMNWILSVTPRGGADGVAIGASGSLVPTPSGTGVESETLKAKGAATATATGRPLESSGGSGQHSALLRKLLTEKLSGSPTASPSGSPRLTTTEGGAAVTAGGSDRPTSPNFTQSELNLLLHALGGTGNTPPGVAAANAPGPFGRADATATSPARGGTRASTRKRK
jgi:hypothetical protein